MAAFSYDFYMIKNINMGLRWFFKIYKKDGLYSIYLRILRFFGYKLPYNNIIEKFKFKFQEKIILISKNKVLNGYYKDTFLNCKGSCGIPDYSSKLLGLYEKQVQEKILELKKKFKLSFIVNFGTSDGFHILGLLKNNFFKKGLAFEINTSEQKNLIENIKKNNLKKKIEVFKKANFIDVFKILSDKDLAKTLFLVDIEGNEFDLFNEGMKQDYLKKIKKSCFIIEDHSWFLKSKKIRNFKKSIEMNFNVKILENSGRDPHIFDFLNNFSDDEKWLMMSEGRPSSMFWYILTPK